MNNEIITKTQSALAIVDDLQLADVDYLQHRWPNLSAGHRCIIYGGLALATLPSLGPWAALGAVAVPVTTGIVAAGMTAATLIKALGEDDQYDDETGEQPAIEAHAETVLEPPAEPGPEYGSVPWGNLPKRQVESSVYSDPLDKAQATGMSLEEVLKQDRELLDADIRQQGTQIGETLVKSIYRPGGTVFEEPPAIQPFDIAKYIAHKPLPLLLTAAPRSGKGVVAAQLIREFKQENPQGIAWVIQPKYHPDEYGYWSGADLLWGDMIEKYMGEPDEIDRITKEWEKLIRDWLAAPQRPKMLIIDEGVKIRAIAKKWFDSFLTSFIKVEASSGETDKRTLVYISQSSLVRDLGMSTGDRSSFAIAYLAVPTKQSHLKTFLSSYDNVDAPTQDLYEASESPKQAVVYHSDIGEWYPLPEYPVYLADKPDPRNVAGKVLASAAHQASYGPEFKEPSPWGQPSAQTIDWDFGDAEDGDIATIAPELYAKASQLKSSSDPRHTCAAEFLEYLFELGDGRVVGSSDIGKSSWASRWNTKGTVAGGLKDRSANSLKPFISNSIKFGFLVAADEKYQVVIK